MSIKFCCLLFIPLTRSSMVRSNCDSQEWWDLNPNYIWRIVSPQQQRNSAAPMATAPNNTTDAGPPCTISDCEVSSPTNPLSSPVCQSDDQLANGPFTHQLRALVMFSIQDEA